MKAKNTVILCIFILVAVGLNYLAYYGVNINIPNLNINQQNIFSVRNIKQGLDLKGGVTIVYEAEKEGDPTADEMKSALSLMQGRLDRKGWTEAEVAQQGSNRIRADIPGVEDTQTTVDEIGKTAQLMFADEDGNVLLTGADVKNASKEVLSSSQTDPGRSNIQVLLEFTPEGQSKFSEATGNNIGKPLYILLDEAIISAPVVNSKIDGGSAVIQGTFTSDEADELSALIRAGSLPFNLKVLSTNKVGARLGAEALNSGLMAGAVGFGLIILLMLVLYRVAGLAADLALMIYIGLQLIVLSLFGVTLTLPGIAGIILSVGMAVDANIIIFERIKDEIKSGKSMRVSMHVGFKRAFPAIFDSNITTIMAALVLYWLGTGPVRGFAQTLIIGIVISMFTALTITRLIIKSIMGLGISNNALFGAKLDQKAIVPMDIIKNKGKYFMVSGIVILVGLIFMIGNAVKGNGPFNYDVEFAGGTQMVVDIGVPFENGDIQQIVIDTTEQPSPQIQKIVGTNQVSIKVRSLDQETQKALIDALKEKYSLEDGVFTTSDVSATISSEMQSTAMMAVVVACVVMLIYVSFRFRDIKTGGAAICALIHDVIIVTLSYAVFRIPLSYSFIAAILTILGYSINATIVVFDRIRENKTLLRRPTPEELINTSITQTIKRCIYTSLSVFIVTLSLYVLGVPLIKDFMLPIMVGVVCGTYSSIFLAGSIWYVFVSGFKNTSAK